MLERGGTFRRLCAFGLFGLLGLGLTLAAVAQDASSKEPAAAGFKVIVHSDNPEEEMKASAIAKMFLKKVKRWDHGVSVTPIDLSPSHPIRKVFTKAIHNKSVTAIKSFWQRMIFSGREEPPTEKASESDVLSIVRTTPGAIAYVAADTSLGDGVKELKIAQ